MCQKQCVGVEWFKEKNDRNNLVDEGFITEGCSKEMMYELRYKELVRAIHV